MTKVENKRNNKKSGGCTQEGNLLLTGVPERKHRGNEGEQIIKEITQSGCAEMQNHYK